MGMLCAAQTFSTCIVRSKIVSDDVDDFIQKLTAVFDIVAVDHNDNANVTFWQVCHECGCTDISPAMTEYLFSK